MDGAPDTGPAPPHEGGTQGAQRDGGQPRQEQEQELQLQQQQQPLAALALNDEVDASELVGNDNLIADILANQQQEVPPELAAAQQAPDGEELLEREIQRVRHEAEERRARGALHAGGAHDPAEEDGPGASLAPEISAFLAEAQVREEHRHAFLQTQLPPDIDRAVTEEMYNPMYQLPEDPSGPAASSALIAELLDDEPPLSALEPIVRMDEEADTQSETSEAGGITKSARRNVFSVLSEASGGVEARPPGAELLLSKRATRLRTGSMQRKHYSATAVYPADSPTPSAPAASSASAYAPTTVPTRPSRSSRSQQHRQKEDEDMYDPKADADSSSDREEEEQEEEDEEDETRDAEWSADKSPEEGRQVWCLCRTSDDSGFMIGCDGGCDNW
jgi:hypothetical protein